MVRGHILTFTASHIFLDGLKLFAEFWVFSFVLLNFVCFSYFAESFRTFPLGKFYVTLRNAFKLCIAQKLLLTILVLMEF